MSAKVKNEDKEKSVEYLRMALNMAHLNVDYVTTDLIIKMKKAVDEKGGKFSLKDGAVIETQWREKWDKYFKEQNDENI